MGEAQTPHFYDFGIFEPVTKPQNQLVLSLETPGYLTKSINSLEHLKNIIFVNLRILGIQVSVIFRKDWRRQIPPIRLIKTLKSWI